jgi:hypothetical protein
MKNNPIKYFMNKQILRVALGMAVLCGAGTAVAQEVKPSNVPTNIKSAKSIFETVQQQQHGKAKREFFKADVKSADGKEAPKETLRVYDYNIPQTSKEQQERMKTMKAPNAAAAGKN